jgi:hypothetical protein
MQIPYCFCAQGSRRYGVSEIDRLPSPISVQSRAGPAMHRHPAVRYHSMYYHASPARSTGDRCLLMEAAFLKPLLGVHLFLDRYHVGAGVLCYHYCSLLRVSFHEIMHDSGDKLRRRRTHHLPNLRAVRHSQCRLWPCLDMKKFWISLL